MKGADKPLSTDLMVVAQQNCSDECNQASEISQGHEARWNRVQFVEFTRTGSKLAFVAIQT
jgi:hypothetical protein